MRSHQLIPIVASAVLACASASVTLAQSGGTLGAEYYKRLAALAPRSALAHFELARWCEESGLEAEARTLLERTIRIDPDHVGARSALGYRRYGLEWIIGDGPAPIPSPDEIEEPPEVGEEELVNSGTGRDGKPITEAPATGSDPSPAGEANVVPKSLTAEEIVTLKRDFARKAEELLKTKLNTKEDADFLLHTNYEINAPQLRQLQAELKAIKKNITTLVGGPRDADLWPEKLQIFFFRSTSGCVTFSEVVDGDRFPERAGWYQKDGHLVFSEIESEVLSRILGESSLDHFAGSKRFVNWWLRVGLGELLAAQTLPGKDRKIYEDAYRLVGSQLEGVAASISVFDLLQTPGMPRTQQRESRAQAMTLVDFLIRAGKPKFQKLIATLKSQKAPEPPAELEGDPFRRFFVEFIGFQEAALKSSYRLAPERLDAGWKGFVRTQAKRFEAQ